MTVPGLTSVARTVPVVGARSGLLRDSSPVARPSTGLAIQHGQSGVSALNGELDTDALRHTGILTTRNEVSERIRDQLVLKRHLRQRWLQQAASGQLAAELRSPVSAATVGRSGNASGSTAFPFQGLPSATQALSSSLQQLLAEYRAFFARKALRMGISAVGQGGFQSRRHMAERALSRFFGLSGTELRKAVLDLVSSAEQEGAEEVSRLPLVSGNSGNSGNDAGHHDQSGGSMGQSDLHGDIADEQPQGAAGLLRDYMLAEIAQSDISLTPEQRVFALKRQAEIFDRDAMALQAAESIAQLALEQTENAAQDGGKLPQPKPADIHLRGQTLHDICNGLLRLYPADVLMTTLSSLINSVEALGNRRSFFGDGVALSDCLTRIRNLSVISLIMDKTEQLKSRMLFSFHTGKLPSDEIIWRALCKVTQMRSIDPLLFALQEGDLTPSSKRVFLQGLQTILRDLPIGVWSDPENRGAVLSMLSDASSTVDTASASGRTG